MFFFDVSLEGNRQLVADLLQTANAFAESSDEAKQSEVFVAGLAAEIAPAYTPVISGSLASSHAVLADAQNTILTIAPDAVNPWSDENPPEYGPKVHEMGGFSFSGHERAFYDVLVREEGEMLLDLFEDEFIGTLEVFK